MNSIIDPVPVELLKAELTKSKKLEDTNKGHNELYIVTWHDSPNVVTEIGRLRELTFREAGGSTGNAIDLDEYDKMEIPYKQLIVWDPDNEAIVGGYRFFYGSDAVFDEKGQPVLASSHQFRFSQKFIDEYLLHVLELGRNFVAPAYQSSKNGAKSIYVMDNLWDGLVAIIMKNPNLLYYFGKITIYPSYDHITRDLIYHFLRKHYGDTDELVRPWDDQALMPDSDPELMDLVLNKEDLLEDYKLLKAAANSFEELTDYTESLPNLNKIVENAEALSDSSTVHAEEEFSVKTSYNWDDYDYSSENRISIRMDTDKEAKTLLDHQEESRCEGRCWK